jgi:hypothetical protein
MIGNSSIGFCGLIGLIQQSNSVVFILMREVNFYTFACEIFERIIVMLAIDGLIEYAIFGFIGVVYVDRFLI